MSLPAYCTKETVALFIGRPSAYFTASTTPTATQIEEWLERKTAEIEARTNRAWLPRNAHLEYHSIPYNRVLMQVYSFKRFKRVYLRHGGVKTLDSTLGDSLEVFDGSTWYDWLANKTEGRSQDYWVEPEDGYLFLNAQPSREGARISYRYNEGADTLLDDATGVNTTDATFTVDSTTGFPDVGYFLIDSENVYYSAKTATTFTGCTRGARGTTAASHADNAPIYFVPDRVSNLCAKMVCLELIQGDDYSVLFPEGSSNVPLATKRSTWLNEVERELQQLQRVVLPT